MQTGRPVGVVLQAGNAMLVTLRAGVNFMVVMRVVVDSGGPYFILAERTSRKTGDSPHVHHRNQGHRVACATS
jgi:hypothetical protein